MKLSDTIEINDRVQVTLANKSEEFQAVVTGIDDVLELVFVTLTETQEETVVGPNQVQANFGQ